MQSGFKEGHYTEDDEIFDTFKQRMETDGLYFVGPDAIECLKQKNYQAIEQCLLLKSMLREPEYRDILEPIAEGALDGKIKLNLHLVEEDTDVGQRL